jgi:uncharacterized protein YdeI (YjbR/CyaY-like superfamily)
MQLGFKTREEFRQWLAEHHNSEKELWLVFYKKNSGVQSINYEEAVCEALCFGWIDSLVHGIDKEKYEQKFTPRNPKSNWSDLNKRRVKRLIDEGKMTDAGMKLITYNLSDPLEETTPAKKKEYLKLPDKYMQILAGDVDAFAYFNKIPPSHRHEYASYIMDAKKEETRLRRLGKVIETLKEQKHRLF